MSETPRSATSGRATPFVKMLLVVTAVSAVALLSGLGCHQRYGHHGDPERLREFAEWRVERMLKKIDATPDQTESVLTVVDGLVADLTAMHEDRGDMRETLVAQLTAETIDRPALEAMRAQKMEEFDVASRRVVDAVASVGEILSQDQRLELAEEARNHHPRHRGHHGWGHN